MNTADRNFYKLAESDSLILGHEFEYAFLISKHGKKEVFCYEFAYGDPGCGLIGPDNNWCAVGGNELVVWTRAKGTQQFLEPEICWISAMRLKSFNELEFLVDPYSEYGAVWSLNIQTMEKYKIRDFYLSSEPYTDDIHW
ncbi:hypothetical protein [Mucilaginibacter sp.]|jgi:hypothetical protein|uniref:hypothetical protein n=1 Tax=Mucilaginibacter sp. TaxID=1882438 RepID=UPI0025EDA8AC|nr:hypothetical protein [Mucilaginibacter sp.]